MCGIAGFANLNSNFDYKKLISSLHHRGPDNSGFYIDKENSLVFTHNRLNIVDIQNGTQPMNDDDGDICIVYNGEIFNHLELREKLESKGFKFFTKNSDTETLINMYKKYSYEMLKHLNGMFAFVIYDKKKKILFGSRDISGIKPLFFSHKGPFIFSSEINAFFNFDFIKKKINQTSISNYLAIQYVPFEQTIYSDIQQLRPGQYFEYDLKKKSLKIEKYISYSDFFNNNKYYNLKYKEIVEQGKEIITKAINDWTMSDVGFSLSLSGGLDSSLICSILEKKIKKKINTYTVFFEEDKQSIEDAICAKMMSKKINSNHTEICIDSNNLMQNLDRIVNTLSQPYGGSLASWFIYQNMNSRDKVILTGTGADEFFGNYGKWTNYYPSKFYFQNILKNLKFLNKDFLKNYDFNFLKFAFDNYELIKLIQKQPNLQKIKDNIINFRSSLEKKNYKNISKLISLEMQLPNEFLSMTDQFSMNFSKEARTPFLDKNIMSFFLSINSSYDGNYFNSKKLLKDISLELLPKKIINRRKAGFVLPYYHWLKKDLKGDLNTVFEKNFLEKQNIFNVKYIENLLNLFNSKNYIANNLVCNKVWTLFMFQKWYINSNSYI